MQLVIQFVFRLNKLCFVAYSTLTRNRNTKQTCVGVIKNATSSLFFKRKLIFVSISELSIGTVRLYQRGISLPSYSHGIVQIYMDNQWGNICKDSKFKQKEADVVCHQLSYTGASSYSSAGVMR